MKNTLRRKDDAEQAGVTEEITRTDSASSPSPLPVSSTSPSSWRYRSPRIGSLSLPAYANPFSQLIIVSFVCFLCPGMFNALSAMGGAGLKSPSLGDKANTALYSTFAVVGFFAGSVVNRVGVKPALSFGGLGYCIYVSSFLCYNHTGNQGFAIFAGAWLGVCAGILWCAQATIMISYPTEEYKGRYISWFWMIFNLGAVIGGLIPLGQNIHTKSSGTVSDGAYVGFIVLTGLGAALAWCLINSKDVVRPDGSKIILIKNPSWKSELLGLWTTLKIEPYIVLLFPMFFSSNWFYTYHFNTVNGARFDVRTRALNSVLYWSMQIVGAGMFGYCLDFKRIERPMRARIAWGALMVLTMAIWGGGYAWQKGFTRASVKSGATPILDWTSHGYVGPMFLYMFYGFYDAAWQTCVYWFMGALSNNSRQLANYAGFYKGIQSAGAAIMWRADDIGMSYMAELASNWGLLAGSLVVALPLIVWKVRDHVPVEEDLRFTDETVDDVLPSADLKNKEFGEA